jgi:protein gp37
MPNKTNIEWCDVSVNPLRARHDGKRGWSCAKISPGCLHCYSEAINHRFGNGLDYNGAGVKAAEHYLEMKELGEILRFKRKPPFKNGRTRCMVFPFDMTDLYGDWVPDHVIDTFMAVVALRPDVDFMVLTKRAERLPVYWNSPDLPHRIYNVIFDWINAGTHGFLGKQLSRAMRLHVATAKTSLDGMYWPLPLANLWQGVSVEDQTRADQRLPELAEANVAVRFVSYEPLLELVDPTEWICRTDLGIIGGESGAGARPCDLAWIEALVCEHKANGVACFVKQIGSNATAWCPEHRGNPLLGPFVSNTIRHPKGGDPAEWPEELRVRQFPFLEQKDGQATAVGRG